jgi:hypothetical protein
MDFLAGTALDVGISHVFYFQRDAKKQSVCLAAFLADGTAERNCPGICVSNFVFVLLVRLRKWPETPRWVGRDAVCVSQCTWLVRCGGGGKRQLIFNGGVSD